MLILSGPQDFEWVRQRLLCVLGVISSILAVLIYRLKYLFIDYFPERGCDHSMREEIQIQQ